MTLCTLLCLHKLLPCHLLTTFSLCFAAMDVKLLLCAWTFLCLGGKWTHSDCFRYPWPITGGLTMVVTVGTSTTRTGHGSIVSIITNLNRFIILAFQSKTSNKTVHFFLTDAYITRANVKPYDRLVALKSTLGQQQSKIDNGLFNSSPNWQNFYC